MSLHIEAFSGSPEEWDAYGARQPGWTAFHRFGWKSVIENVFGHECHFLAAREGTTLLGILPLVRVKSVIFGHYLVSMPFVNYGGPLGTAEAVRQLSGAATTLAQQSGARLLELRSRVSQPLDLPVSHRKITVVLDVPPEDAAGLWKRLDAKVRNQVRRPQKEGVTVRFGPDELEPFYTVFAHHMRDLGTPVQSRRLFESIREAFGDDVWFGCAYLGGRAVAGGCGFRWAQEFEMTWASSLAAYNRIAPNMLLYWSFLERVAQQRLTTFNFGRCTVDSGTHKFKRQWGGRDEPLWWYQWSPDTTTAKTPSPDDAAFAWGPRLWKRLPVALATALGPRIVRYIP